MLRGRLSGLFVAASVLLVGGCQWSTIPKDAIYACSKGVCPTGQTCQEGFCVPAAIVVEDAGFDAGCAAKSCAELGLNCGDVSDGCGQKLHCGVCVSPTSCGGSGTPNVCGCVPSVVTSIDACSDAGVGCGSLSRLNSCGAMVQFSCGGQCSCTGLGASFFCSDAGFDCGEYRITDNCGRPQVFNCGDCGLGDSCVTGDFGGVCEPCQPEDDGRFCDRQGANCGSLQAPDNCGALRMADCGGCSPLDAGCGAKVENLCQCQPNRAGCASENQCCSGVCGKSGLCCEPEGHACVDDSDCCKGSCALGFCEILAVQ